MNKIYRRLILAKQASVFILEEIIKNDYMGKLNRIILFGSVARGTADEESDIDLFVDLFERPTKKIENFFKNLEEEFMNSNLYTFYRTFGVNNKLKITAGALSEWKELMESILVDGIILYGKFSSGFEIQTSGMYNLYYWDSLDIKNRGAFLNKLFGFTTKGKRYHGLIHKIKGQKLGKNVLLVPIESAKVVEDLFKKYKVDIKYKQIMLAQA